jgi:RHS repeat-associated protein
VICCSDDGLYFRLADHLGSTSLISDSTGTKVTGSDVVFAPYGDIRTPSDPSTLTTLTDFMFTGQRLDRSTGGLMDYGARYYLPGLARFISADTIVPNAGNPQTLNRFSYVRDNPLKLIDPSGHIDVDTYCSFHPNTQTCNNAGGGFGGGGGTKTTTTTTTATATGGGVGDPLPNSSGGPDDRPSSNAAQTAHLSVAFPNQYGYPSAAQLYQTYSDYLAWASHPCSNTCYQPLAADYSQFSYALGYRVNMTGYGILSGPSGYKYNTDFSGYRSSYVASDATSPEDIILLYAAAAQRPGTWDSYDVAKKWLNFVTPASGSSREMAFRSLRDLET